MPQPTEVTHRDGGLRGQCHLVFPDSGICSWGEPLACAGRPPGSSTILQDPKSAAESRAQTERLPHQN